MRAIRRFTVRPVLPDALASLGELAANLRWSWHPPTQALFEAVDAGLWQDVGHDPLRLLGEVAAERWAELVADEDYVRRVADVRADLAAYLAEDRWYQRARAAEPDRTWPESIAYFSPEYGITAVLPQYSGGLGILAGDHLKAASDLGVPVVGVGLLYRHGYFKQALSRDGWQQESYPLLDPDGLPLSLLHEQDGSRATIAIRMPDGPDLLARIFVASVGRVPLLLLDTDVEENPEAYRLVTDRLYGGNTEHRLRQELLLGVGGVRALRAFSRITGAPEPEVFHTNEGHAGFLGVERIRELTADGDGGQVDFATALEAGRASTVFTTHTPVPAGIDRFPRTLVEQYLGEHGATPGVPVDQVLSLGAEDYDGGDPGVFNMAVMGFRLAQRANGVSQLHGQVSRGMFNGLWPAFDEAEVPIASITNGVHAPTWVAPEVVALAEAQGADYHGDDATAFWAAFDKVPGTDVWRTKRRLRERLVDDARRRLRKSWEKRGASPAELGWIDDALDPDVLTIGFARRVPSYKRLTLMLRDPARLKALLLHPERPVQLVVAGKAHPADDGGKRLIQELVRFADAEDVRHRIVFLPNYDIALAQPLYPGCDVWLNNPLRPYEACGTSGMKAALNGGLNLSILDGWWDEWYEPEFGWPIPSADGLEDYSDKRDDLEAAALYDLIENEVAPRFYDHDHEGVPAGWVEMLRHTWASLGPKVLATRMVRDYVEQLYAPAARNARALAAVENGARDLAAWKARVRSAWPGVRVEHVEAEGIGDVAEVGAVLHVRSYVALGELAPHDVEVQLVHGRVDAEDDIVAASVVPLALVESYDGGRHRFDGEVALGHSGPFGYTVRVLPANPLLVAPAELGVVALA
ncbi:alpha-glucan family phosphorylase [Nocardioides carbamazepini]|uniref:alpha-glucan family phosphorylase n=1 Tax=Nocardioides carbamazepini TaxID=2854259 RepID=UPI00214A0041|nr:alpha-glucan family phosphorylase [Nocardioides carbamazepini]MCR1782404.1 alpha-glucan family phosphorylase [Nocardioides carbamazepini]